MKRVRIRLIAFVLLLPLLAASFVAAPARAASGDTGFPNLELPANPDAVRDFGLAADATSFHLSDIPAEVVVLELSSYFCGPCHEEAPKLARLQELLVLRGLSKRVKLVGVALGDNAELAGRFSAKYAFTHPYLPDPDMHVLAQLGNLPVPTLFVVRLGEPNRLVFRQIGLFEETPERMLDLILKAADIST